MEADAKLSVIVRESTEARVVEAERELGAERKWRRQSANCAKSAAFSLAMSPDFCRRRSILRASMVNTEVEFYKDDLDSR